MAGGSNNALVNRVDLEFYPGNGAAGLIQDGMALAKEPDGLDDCGPKANVHEFIETKKISPSTTNFHCYWIGGTPPGTDEHFTVGKSFYEADCSGCYEARIGGLTQLPPGAVSLATSYGSGYAAAYGLLSSEVLFDHSANYEYFYFGTTQEWGWSNALLSADDWNTVTSSKLQGCVDRDKAHVDDPAHFNFAPIFVNGTSISLRVSQGPKCYE